MISSIWSAGEVVTLDFPFSDGEGSKSRPALILAGPTALGDYTFAMISRSQMDDGISITAADFSSGALNADSFVRVKHVFTCEGSCVVTKRGSLAPKAIKRVLAALCPALGCKF